MRINTPARRIVTLGGAAALLVSGIVALSAPADAAAVTYTAAPAVGAGASSTALSVVITGKGFRSASNAALYKAWAASTASGIQVATGCGTTLATIAGNITNSGTDGVTSVSVPSATRMVVTLKNLPLAAGPVKKDYKVCVYSTTGSAGSNVLLGSAAFTAYPAPTVTGVTPNAGPLFGGSTIAIDGTNFTAKSTVTVGGVAATGVTFIDSTSMTAVVPTSTTAAAKAVKVTNEGGPSSTQNYTYTDAIAVAPATGLAAGGLTLTIKGSGFNSKTWGTDTTPIAAGDIGAYVLFMDGNTAFDPTDNSGVLTVSPDAFCQNVVVVSDTELNCDTPALTTLHHYGVYIVDDATDGGTPNTTAVSSTSTFTVAPF
jgi:hypothetical protein